MIVIDHLDYRLEFARTLRPAEVYNFREIDDLVVFLKKHDRLARRRTCASTRSAATRRATRCNTLLGTKLKLEAGNAIALHWAINSVKKGGIVSIVGVYGPTGNMIPIGNVVNKGITDPRQPGLGEAAAAAADRAHRRPGG